jgi:hypothetical protein
LGYIGNHGINEPVTNFPNACTPDPATGACDGTTSANGFPASAFSPNFATVTEVYSGAVSNDNQLTASYQRRLTYGFSIQASYTWAHAMDEISNGGLLPYAQRSITYQLNPFNLGANYGNADYDIRNYFNAQYVWNTPWKFSGKWMNFAFGGWTLSQNFFARSGLPVTVLDAGNSPGNFNGNLLPAEVVGNGQGSCTNGLSMCFNPGAFVSAAGLPTFPNQLRGQYRGPGFFDSDLSLNKNFKITERVAFGVGATAYNVFNHPNFAQPHDALGSGTFGTITAQTAPPTTPFGSFFSGLPANRILQLQGKIIF